MFRILSLSLSLMVVSFVSTSSYAAGVGISLFGPNGVTFKSSKVDEVAYDASVGTMNRSKYDRHIVQGTYLIHFDKHLYYGFGARIFQTQYHHNHWHGRNHVHHHDEDYTGLAARFPFGARFSVERAPKAVRNIEFFAEVAVLVEVLPGFLPKADFATGARYFFRP